MIEVLNLVKKFDNNTVLDGISFTVKKGEVFGYLGPNGAGKTTTIRILTGIIEPSSGNVYIDGQEIRDAKKQIRARSGLLTENPGFYERFNAIDNISFFSSLYGMDEKEINERTEYFFKMFGLWDYRFQPLGTFSKGMKQKLALIRSIIHDPDYIYLDEPTASLDPETSSTVRSFIRELKKNGKTVFLSTHNLNEAEEVCDRVAILNKRIVGFGTPEDLKSKVFGKKIIIEFDGDAKKAAEILSAMGLIFNIDGKRIIIENVPKNSAVIKSLINAGIDVEYVYREEHSLEEIYMEMVR